MKNPNMDKQSKIENINKMQILKSNSKFNDDDEDFIKELRPRKICSNLNKQITNKYTDDILNNEDEKLLLLNYLNFANKKFINDDYNDTKKALNKLSDVQISDYNIKDNYNNKNVNDNNESKRKTKIPQSLFDKNSSDNDSEGVEFSFWNKNYSNANSKKSLHFDIFVESKTTTEGFQCKKLVENFNEDKDNNLYTKPDFTKLHSQELDSCITSISLKKPLNISVPNLNDLEKIIGKPVIIKSTSSEEDFTNTEEILDFNQYNLECLEQIKKLKR